MNAQKLYAIQRNETNTLCIPQMKPQKLIGWSQLILTNAIAKKCECFVKLPLHGHCPKAKCNKTISIYNPNALIQNLQKMLIRFAVNSSNGLAVIYGQ